MEFSLHIIGLIHFKFKGTWLVKTLDCLHEGLSIKWPDKSFQENFIFPKIEEIVGSALELAAKKAFLIGQEPIKI